MQTADQPSDSTLSEQPNGPGSEVASEQEVARLQAELDAKERQLANRFREIAALAALLRAEEQKNAHLRNEFAWIAQLVTRIMRQPRTWSFLPAAARRDKQRQFLQQTGLFDAAAYFEIHPDVASSGEDPLHHYLIHGLQEGRSRAHRVDAGADDQRG